MHVVCSWIGNTPAVARKHYLQTTEEHFRRAAAGDAAMQITLQIPGAKPCKAMHDEFQPETGTADNARVYSNSQPVAACPPFGWSTPGRNRTCDLRFRKPLLYPLSYRRITSPLAIGEDTPGFRFCQACLDAAHKRKGGGKESPFRADPYEYISHFPTASKAFLKCSIVGRRFSAGQVMAITSKRAGYSNRR